jgi:hypothetical protein
MTTLDNPLSLDVFCRLMSPKAWAHDALLATKTGWPMSPALTELALRMTGDIDGAEELAIKADLAYARIKNSGDLMRYESQRALEAQIQHDDAFSPTQN